MPWDPDLHTECLSNKAKVLLLLLHMLLEWTVLQHAQLRHWKMPEALAHPSMIVVEQRLSAAATCEQA